MNIIKLPGTCKELYERVSPLVMNPAVLRQNNNYPFKTGFRYVWYVAVQDGQTIGFMPVKNAGSENLMIDNYYIKGDDASVLKELLAKIIEDNPPQAALWATVHKRHIKSFAQNHFRTYIEWKNYDKMQYCPEESVACTD